MVQTPLVTPSIELPFALPIFNDQPADEPPAAVPLIVTTPLLTSSPVIIPAPIDPLEIEPNLAEKPSFITHLEVVPPLLIATQPKSGVYALPARLRKQDRQ
jgi:hypothetical protein